MPAQEHILHKVRTALGRSAGQPAAPAPAALLRASRIDAAEKMRLLLERFPGRALRAASLAEARHYVASLIRGRRAVASSSPLLAQSGILDLPEVAAPSREACAAADFGITTAEYALADTGALVVLATSEEARLASLLPVVHITLMRTDRILASLDELFTVLPDPAAVSSSMVLIGGPSKTADIEQILTLGVHGPREIHVVLLDPR